MQPRHHPLRWPLSIGLACLLVLGVVFFTPETWLDIFFSPLDGHEDSGRRPSTSWLILHPPPEILVARPEPDLPDKKLEKPRQEAPPPDPRWWTEGWRVKVDNEATLLPGPTRKDSVMVVLETLNLTRDWASLARPDSILDHRLMLLRIEDSFAFDELKPYLQALGKQWHMKDKASREADIYDEHLGSVIMVPD